MKSKNLKYYFLPAILFFFAAAKGQEIKEVHKNSIYHFQAGVLSAVLMPGEFTSGKYMLNKGIYSNLMLQRKIKTLSIGLEYFSKNYKDNFSKGVQKNYLSYVSVPVHFGLLFNNYSNVQFNPFIGINTTFRVSSLVRPNANSKTYYNLTKMYQKNLNFHSTLGANWIVKTKYPKTKVRFGLQFQYEIWDDYEQQYSTGSSLASAPSSNYRRALLFNVGIHKTL